MGAAGLSACINLLGTVFVLSRFARFPGPGWVNDFHRSRVNFSG
jgi:hypothetical protein